METLSILAAIFITAGLGFSTLRLSKTTLHQNMLIAIVEVIAVGLAAFSFLAVILDLLFVPLHIVVYVGITIAAIVAALLLRKDRSGLPRFDVRSWESVCLIILLLALIPFFIIYLKGANAYPYLENDDPWLHAQGVEYVSRMHTYHVSAEAEKMGAEFAFYLEPYPPTFDVIIGVLRQTGTQVVWALKFFNVVLCTLAILFFYLFAKEYLGSDLKALLASSILLVLPSFMSHFIWNQSLALALFPVGLYAILRAVKDTSWIVPAILCVASMMVTQPVVSFLFGIVVIILFILVAIHDALRADDTNKLAPATAQLKDGKRTKHPAGTSSESMWRRIYRRYTTTRIVFLVAFGGLMLSMFFWGKQIIIRGITGVIKAHADVTSEGAAGWAVGYTLQKYSWREVVFAPMQSRIDQAIGWGPAVALLVALGIIIIVITAKRSLSLKHGWLHWHMLIWFTMLLYIVFAPTFNLPSFGTSRAWAYLAIPLALIAAEGIGIIIHSISKNMALRFGVILVICIVVGITSAPAKIAVQTAQWPPGVSWTAPELEIPAYLGMGQSLSANTRVYSLCGTDARTVGFGMQSDPWDLEQLKFRKSLPNRTSTELVAFLREHDYAYITMDVTCVRNWGQNETDKFISEVLTPSQAQPVATSQGFLLAKVP